MAKMFRLKASLFFMRLFIIGLLLNLSPSQAGAATVDVKAEDDNYATYTFIPSEVTVSVGDTVRWIKGFSALPHSVFGDSTTKDYYGNTCINGPLNGSLSKPQDTFSFTFDTPGDCHYQCIIHPPDMLGVIHVLAKGPASDASSPTPTMVAPPSAKESLGSSVKNEGEQNSITGGAGKPFKPPSILGKKPSGQENPTGKTIRGDRFELVDGKGKVRAVLEMTPSDEPRLALADRTGQIQAMLSVEPVPGHPDGIPTLRLFDKAGKPRTDISLNSDGDPVVVLRNKNGVDLASLSGLDAASGGTGLLLNDENGQIRVELRINHLGTNLYLFDKDRKARARFGLKPDGSPVFVFLNAIGEEEDVSGNKGFK